MFVCKIMRSIRVTNLKDISNLYGLNYMLVFIYTDIGINRVYISISTGKSFV